MSKGRILAIDDEAFFRDFYQELLSEEGYRVRTAASGAEALKWLRREDFDLVITDMDMDGMNGVETSAAIKKFNPDQEIMVVTAREDVSLAVEAMKRGVSEYLLKPINPDEFLLVINRILFRQSLGSEHQRLMHENIEFISLLAYYRKCLAFLRVHDIDRLGDLILDTLMEMLRAEGGLLWLVAYGGHSFRLRCRRGLVRVAPGREKLEPGAGEERLFRSGVPALDDNGRAMLIPLQVEQESLAVIRIEAPTGREAFNRHDLKRAEMVSEFAATALHNVLTYRSLAHDSLRIPHSEAYKMAYFRDHVAKELHKARRYNRNLSFIKLNVVNYAELAAHFRDRDLDEAMARLVEIINTALRDADIMALAAPGMYYIMLPETDYWGSLVTQQRIRRALSGKLTLCDLKKSYPLKVFLRSAAYPVDGESFEELIAVAARRQERLQHSLYHRGRMEQSSFWGVVGRLLGAPGDYDFSGPALKVSARLQAFQDELSSSYFRMPFWQFRELQKSFSRDVVESRRVRGIIYRGCRDFDEVRRNLPDLDAIERSATSLFLLGGRHRVNWELQRVVPIHIDDEHFSRVSFLLYLNEDYAYALFARRRGDELVGFHSSDFYFVENMIAKLQVQYRLQPKI
ncbi:hypothetical protein C2E25_04620 [Geothermobacter hydrogeniphilus]|uniref:Response regulatory domain-containing protein n=1 Tax=Geothermobacter hydrogeniphilus TaxID=1969733 RepID=A0A2K2HCC9_9BACT|nr:response regulator [Geothermobacter hydrogeniphilus]PNU20879.1 hypothetical protein C2E25_04620 [Geothermobacter hydrogeniphilus]